MPRIPRVTAVLLIANVLVFLLQQVAADFMLAHFALWPFGVHKMTQLDDGTVVSLGFQPWQLITYSFLHGGVTHIAFNMLALWMFGGPVEEALGPRRYTLYYFVCVLGAAVAQLATVALMQPHAFYPTLGASGGVFGVLLAFAILYPQARVFLFFIPVPVPARIAVVGYLILELFFGVTGRQADVAHFAHLGGALIGFVLILFWRSRQRRF
ncbi:MAG TPA: rhomboid family intramembrane serine protease [Rudaea sp.]|nr:rhomboid family intramembrane serine protease [Rudaea sp.]